MNHRVRPDIKPKEVERMTTGELNLIIPSCPAPCCGERRIIGRIETSKHGERQRSVIGNADCNGLAEAQPVADPLQSSYTWKMLCMNCAEVTELQYLSSNEV